MMTLKYSLGKYIAAMSMGSALSVFCELATEYNTKDSVKLSII